MHSAGFEYNTVFDIFIGTSSNKVVPELRANSTSTRVKPQVKLPTFSPIQLFPKTLRVHLNCQQRL